MFRCPLLSLRGRSVRSWTSRFPGIQRISSSSTVKVSDTNAVRCMKSLKDDHVRIKETMQAFERMLNVLQSEARLFDTVRADRLKDLKKFLTFCNVYSQHHNRKEEILFDYALAKEDKNALKKICEEHKYGAELYNLMEAKASDIGKESELSDQDNNGADHNEKINEVCIPSKTYIHNLYDHMQVEDDVIYPNMEQLFNEQEMEELSQKVDELSYQKANTINAMELLAEELKEKYAEA